MLGSLQCAIYQKSKEKEQPRIEDVQQTLENLEENVSFIFFFFEKIHFLFLKMYNKLSKNEKDEEGSLERIKKHAWNLKAQ